MNANSLLWFERFRIGPEFTASKAADGLTTQSSNQHVHLCSGGVRGRSFEALTSLFDNPNLNYAEKVLVKYRNICNSDSYKFAATLNFTLATPRSMYAKLRVIRLLVKLIVLTS